MKAAAGFALAAAVAVGFVRPRAADLYQGIKVVSDAYALPPPTALLVASLGHRSALADLIFAHVLVSNGIHAQEKRRFEFAGAYLDAVNALDPKFRDPYRYADTLIVFGPDAPRHEHYLKAREVFERGLENLPYDTELWLSAGQYVLYIGGPKMPTDALRVAWKVDGAKMLARACELASANRAIPYNCIASAALLKQSGEAEAWIQTLERIIAVNDDPAVQELAMSYLARYVGERDKGRKEHRRTVFLSAWKRDLPFVTKDMMLVLGPRTDLARCAGRGASSEVECATSWASWAAVADPVPQD